jgi:cyclic 2,3-diphosphoglycerate synthetase
MGRGGPSEPELLRDPPTLETLVAASRAGAHAASDYLEVALLARVATIGCRRAGGGLAGGVFVSNVGEGMRLAALERPDIVVFDGSGASIPPVAADRRVLVVGPGHEASPLEGYRRLIADLVVSVGCEVAGAIPARLELAPQAPLHGRVAVFTAGPADVSHLDADVVHVSASLGDRSALTRELDRLDADTYLCELKGAAIDIVAEDALARGRGFVVAGNDVVSADLDDALDALVPQAVGQ